MRETHICDCMSGYIVLHACTCVRGVLVHVHVFDMYRRLRYYTVGDRAVELCLVALINNSYRNRLIIDTPE